MTTPLSVARASEILGRAAMLRIVVVGDVFLDRYVVGRAERLSREGPVPVLSFRRRFARPGGAANPASNVAALGATALQVGVVGRDDAAHELRTLLEQSAIDTTGLVEDQDRPTTVKTRVVAEGAATPQQIARIDVQRRDAVPSSVEAELVAGLRRAAVGAHAILLSHYRSGVITSGLCAAAREVCGADSWLTVDAQGDLDRFHGFDLIRIGGQDAAETLGQPLGSERDIEQAVRDLRRHLECRVVMLGRGADGMSVDHDGGYGVVPPANASEVFDVTGAGDTVIAVATIALAAGATVDEAVVLSNIAAGLVVRRLGVAAPNRDEILRELEAADVEGRSRVGTVPRRDSA